jgi:hypothetical protein
MQVSRKHALAVYLLIGGLADAAVIAAHTLF